MVSQRAIAHLHPSIAPRGLVSGPGRFQPFINHLLEEIIPHECERVLHVFEAGEVVIDGVV